jgi:hypothetical protein
MKRLFCRASIPVVRGARRSRIARHDAARYPETTRDTAPYNRFI